MPKRIQRSRAAGWRMPEGAVYVGRPTKRGNPFKVGDSVRATPDGPVAVCFSARDAVDTYRALVYRPEMSAFRAEVVSELRGKDLACWCGLCPEHADGKPLGVICDKCEPCHADVLLEIANEPENEVRHG